MTACHIVSSHVCRRSNAPNMIRINLWDPSHNYVVSHPSRDIPIELVAGLKDLLDHGSRVGYAQV
jgi:hypothetical protein